MTISSVTGIILSGEFLPSLRTIKISEFSQKFLPSLDLPIISFLHLHLHLRRSPYSILSCTLNHSFEISALNFFLRKISLLLNSRPILPRPHFLFEGPRSHSLNVLPNQPLFARLFISNFGQKSDRPEFFNPV